MITLANILLLLASVASAEPQVLPVEDMDKPGAMQGLQQNLDSKFSVVGGTVTGESNFTSTVTIKSPLRADGLVFISTTMTLGGEDAGAAGVIDVKRILYINIDSDNSGTNGAIQIWKNQSGETGTGAQLISIDETGGIVGSVPPSPPTANALYRDSVPKGWIIFNQATDAVSDSFNVSSIVDGAAGQDSVRWDTDFANTLYMGMATMDCHELGNCIATTAEAGATTVSCYNNSSALADCSIVKVLAFGDQ